VVADAPRTSGFHQMALVQTASRPSPAACTHTGQRHGLRCLVCDHVYAAADLGTLREASRDGRLDACVRAVREAAGPLGSEAHPQRVLSVEMWFLLILLEGIADLLEADLLPFSSLSWEDRLIRADKTGDFPVSPFFPQPPTPSSW